ncbi:multi-sensor signal transduction histidine kinase [Magnetococcus marinus MC-1]|uniref:histidine kinase n=1 Tax=Magnetococcus marinus (strain ATCC BAA-1437 / JCM 17883 / MC-1) TaxID=156889 RepID=A0LC29_MAGMM|nr:PAS domain S-box protein [Magnetococcus marinus]ABK45522.1 multi-sensor signal transduction histidine kinase [Magnetococcus marinus MC-1]
MKSFIPNATAGVSFFPTMKMAILWSLLMLLLVAGSLFEIKQDMQRLALSQARTALERDLDFRYWASMHGGVYVPMTKITPANPFLAHVDERDISTPSGRQLTLMNPAYMLRQIYQVIRDNGDIQGHLTSLKPLNPGNYADPWEMSALKHFEQGETEVADFLQKDGKSVLRLMQPLITEEGCLKCHAHQGYKLGDVRGGLSVTIHMLPWETMGRQHVLRQGSVIFAIWIIGMFGLWLLGRRIHQETARCWNAETESKQVVLERNKAKQYLDIVGSIIVKLDRDGIVELINNKGCTVLEYSREALLGKNWFDKVSPSDVREQQRKIHTAVCLGQIEGAEYVESAAVTKSGQRRMLAWHHTLVKDDEGQITGSLSAAEDITEQIKMTQALQESIERTRMIAQAAQDAIIMIDEFGRVSFWNAAAERIFGHAESEVLGQDLHTLVAPKRYHESFKRGFAQFAMTGSGAAVDKTLELTALRKDGSEFAMEISLAAVPHGDNWHAVGVVRDISDRKRAEEREQHASFQAGVAEMSISILHNIGNAIMSIMNRSERITSASEALAHTAELFDRVGRSVALKREKGQSDTQILTGLLPAFEEISTKLANMAKADFMENAAAIHQGVFHISEIIKIHQDSAQHTMVTRFDLASLIDDAIMIQSDSLDKYDIEVQLNFTQTLEQVALPRSQLLQLIINLIKNSREAIVTRFQDHDEKGQIIVSVEQKERAWLEIRVQDNGCGIATDKLAETFRFGYTTKEKGTGFGLHSAANFVQSIGGEIVCQSEGLGRGALFIVTLPMEILPNEAGANHPIVKEG